MNQQRVSTIHKGDLVFLNKLNLNQFDAIIAGGAALSWFQGHQLEGRDIDIFFMTHDGFERMNTHLKSFMKISYVSDNALTYTYVTCENESYKVQLIKNVYKTIDDLFNHFDFSICKIATDGNVWWHSDTFIKHLNEKKLVIDSIKPTNVIKRLLKYWQYGYVPSGEILDNIVKNDDVNWNFENLSSGEYNNVI